MTRSLLRTACTTTVLSVQLNLVVPGYYFETWYHFPISLVNSFEHWDLPGFPRPGYPYSKKNWNNSVLEPSNSCFIVNRYSLLGSSKNYSKYFWNIFACPESLPNFGICRYGSKIHHFFWNTVQISIRKHRILDFMLSMINANTLLFTGSQKIPKMTMEHFNVAHALLRKHMLAQFGAAPASSARAPVA